MVNELLERLNKRRAVVDDGALTFESTPDPSSACSKSQESKTDIGPRTLNGGYAAKPSASPDAPKRCGKTDFNEALQRRRLVVDEKGEKFENAHTPSTDSQVDVRSQAAQADVRSQAGFFDLPWERPRVPSAKRQDFKTALSSRRAQVDEEGQTWRGSVAGSIAGIPRPEAKVVEVSCNSSVKPVVVELPEDADNEAPVVKPQPGDEKGDVVEATSELDTEAPSEAQTPSEVEMKPADPDALALFEAAKSLHQQGMRLADAEAGYEAARQMLESEDHDGRPVWEADLLHLLGAIMVQRLCPTDLDEGEFEEDHDEALQVPMPGPKSQNESDVPGSPKSPNKGPFDADRHKRGEMALRHLERAVLLAPDAGRFWQSLGIARWKSAAQGDTDMLEGACEALMKASQLAGGGDRSAVSLEKAHQVLRVIEKGRPPTRRIQVVEEILKLRPNDTRFHFVLGVCYYQIGQTERAVEAFDTHVRVCESVEIADNQSPEVYDVDKAKAWIKSLRM